MAAELRNGITPAYLVAIFAGIWAPITEAQPRGRCTDANWACVAECIDVRCIDRCLADACEARLKTLRACTQQKGCPGTDPTCARAQCGPHCAAAFGKAPSAQTAKAPAEPVDDPCAGRPGTANLPSRLAGRWELQAATLGPQDRFGETSDPNPRPDYDRSLRVEPSGCFVLETHLEDATLGQGNALVVRAWGTLEVTTDARDDDKHTVRLHTEAAQAVGEICAEPRALQLRPQAFRRPKYRAELEADRLTLIEQKADGQTFQFKKVAPED